MSRFYHISCILIAILCGPTILLCSSQATWISMFEEAREPIHMDSITTFNLSFTNLNYAQIVQNQAEIHLISENTRLAIVDKTIPYTDIAPDGTWHGQYDVKAIFMGKTQIHAELHSADHHSLMETSNESQSLIIIRQSRTIDHIFTGSVAVLISLLYINFGAAIDVPKLRNILRKPVGPGIGFFGQFVVMPVLSYVIGLIIFPHSPEMQIGMFFTGCSPAGGASNVWTIVLGGNLDLSITMTTISTLAAFGMMPLWIFTLGKTIFDKHEMEVPYSNIATYAGCLVGPLIIGLLIQRFLPRVAKLLVRVLKPVSALLILFIVIFAIVTNLYLFELFSWEIIVAGMGLPWLGYLIGWFIAKVLRQNPADSLTIGIETGIQNTGLAIFLLRFSLDQPEADLTTVIPVSVAIMTPIPLTCLYIIQLIRRRMQSRRGESLLSKQSPINEKDPATLDDSVTP